MHGKDKDSKFSRLEHLKQIESATGKKPKELIDAPALDESLYYLWEIYMQIYVGKPITPADIYAYSQLYGTITPYESDALMIMSRP